MFRFIISMILILVMIIVVSCSTIPIGDKTPGQHKNSSNAVSEVGCVFFDKIYEVKLCFLSILKFRLLTWERIPEDKLKGGK